MKPKWTEHEILTARQIYADAKAKGVSDRGACKLIGPRINKTWNCVRTRLRDYGSDFVSGIPRKRSGKRFTAKVKTVVVIKSRPDDRAIAERDQMLALQPVSITASLMGDPLPGRSALDKQKERNV